ncbi:MAG: TlpA family protein disulfide reductase [Deltaproteobacteria bacterium]|nr:TlpA family protein disulfide reductase [Deltaproteobacteria bacterium]
MQRLISFLGRLPDFISHPREIAERSVRAIDVVIQLFWYAFMLVVLLAGPLVRNLYLSGEHPAKAARFFWRKLLLSPAPVDFLLWIVAFALLVIIALFLSRKRGMRFSREALEILFYRSSFLLLPVIIGMLLSIFLAQVWREAWWWPHHAINSKVVVLWQADGRGTVSWLRFSLKCVVSYGPSFLFFAAMLKMPLTLQGADLHHDDEDSQSLPQRRKTPAWAWASTLVLFCCAATAAYYPILSNLENHRSLLRGDSIPDVVLPWVRDESPRAKRMKGKFRPSDYRGKVLVLDFWASWCRPCMRAVPKLNQLANESGSDVVVIGINREPGQSARVARVMRENAFAFDSVIDSRAGTRGGFGEKIGLQSLPTTVVIGKDGLVRGLHLGLEGFGDLLSVVEKAAAEKWSP